MRLYWTLIRAGGSGGGGVLTCISRSPGRRARMFPPVLPGRVQAISGMRCVKVALDAFGFAIWRKVACGVLFGLLLLAGPKGEGPR